MKAISAGVGHGEGAGPFRWPRARTSSASATPVTRRTYDADARVGLVVDAVVAARGAGTPHRGAARGGRRPGRSPPRLAAGGACRCGRGRGDVAVRAVTRRGDVRVTRPRVVDLGGAVNIAAGDRDRHLRDLLEEHAGTVAWGLVLARHRASSPSSPSSSVGTPTRSSCGRASTSTCRATTSCSPTAAAAPSPRPRQTWSWGRSGEPVRGWSPASTSARRAVASAPFATGGSWATSGSRAHEGWPTPAAPRRPGPRSRPAWCSSDARPGCLTTPRSTWWRSARPAVKRPPTWGGPRSPVLPTARARADVRLDHLARRCLRGWRGCGGRDRHRGGRRWGWAAAGSSAWTASATGWATTAEGPGSAAAGCGTRWTPVRAAVPRRPCWRGPRRGTATSRGCPAPSRPATGSPR